MQTTVDISNYTPQAMQGDHVTAVNDYTSEELLDAMRLSRREVEFAAQNAAYQPYQSGTFFDIDGNPFDVDVVQADSGVWFSVDGEFCDRWQAAERICKRMLCNYRQRFVIVPEWADDEIDAA